MPKRDPERTDRAKARARKKLQDETVYKFNGDSEDEDYACHFYESARESPGVRELVVRVKQLIREVCAAYPEGLLDPESYADEATPGESEGRRIGVIILTIDGGGRVERFPLPRLGNLDAFAAFVLSLAQDGYFPGTCWRNVPEVERRKMVSIFAHQGPEAPPALLLRPGPDEKTILDFEDELTREYPESAGWGAPVWGHFRLDASASKERIWEALSAYIDVYQKEMAAGPVNKGGRGRISRSRQNELAALRLRDARYGLTQEEASALLGVYYDPSDYRRACASQKEFFRDYIALSDAELPLHNSEGFSK